MAKYHEPFTWRTINEVIPEADDRVKDAIYDYIIKRTWTIDMIEQMYAVYKANF